MSAEPKKFQVSADRLDEIDRDREQAEQQYLRERGWEYSSNWPGSYWLWSREVPPSGVVGVTWQTGKYALSTEGALRVQRAIDAWQSEDFGEDDAGG